MNRKLPSIWTAQKKEIIDIVDVSFVQLLGLRSGDVLLAKDSFLLTV